MGLLGWPPSCHEGKTAGFENLIDRKKNTSQAMAAKRIPNPQDRIRFLGDVQKKRYVENIY
jgi:hypothetical protein